MSAAMAAEADADAKARAFAAVDARLPEFLSLLAAAVQIPTDNPPDEWTPDAGGGTTACAAFLARHLRSAGLPADVFEPEPGKASVVSFVEGSAGPNVVLNGHLDQFPAGDPASWAFDRYSGQVAGDRILGRGVGDMKAGSVISLLTLQLVHELELPIRGRLTLTLVGDEESGGKLGSLWLMDNVPGCVGDCCINSEPSNMDQVLVGHKGKYSLEITTSSPGGMATTPAPADDAIALAMATAAAIKAHVHMWRKPPPAEIAPVVAQAKQKGWEAQGQNQVVDHTTVNVGAIHGGTASNMVPTTCVLEVDLRTPLGTTTDDVHKRLAESFQNGPAELQAALVAGRVDVRWVNELEAAYSSPTAPVVMALAANAAAVTGAPVDVNMSIGSTDARFWWQQGVPAAIYGTRTANVALSDESIPLEDFSNALKVHVGAVIDLLLLPAAADNVMPAAASRL
eukprot:SAG22_NODE_963_length_6279_cov_30.717314_5_plen_455_part_00